MREDSRYQEADRYQTEAHLYDSRGRVLVEKTASTYVPLSSPREVLALYHTLPLPPPPPTEYYAKEWEDFQFLAWKFLQKPTMWWELAEMNPDVWYPLDMKPGQLLRVPM